MTTTARIGLVASLLALAALCAPVAGADDAAQLYDPGTVFFVDLTLSSAAKDALEDEPGEYVQGTFSVTKSADGTPAGEEATPLIAERPVEVRLKGTVGSSFRKLTGKAGFKLKFKKADAVLGLRKMTLNNMVQDPSMIHEMLAYAAFRTAGVPASRTGYAYVRLNGEDFGVYLNLENLDDVALVKLFGSFDDEVQHLYEGEVGDDVDPAGAPGFEIDEGPEDRGDLEALIAAANGGGSAPWSERIAPYANLGEMTKMWAVEKYIDHWDGYAGHTNPEQAAKNERPNNYYLFSEPSGRFQMLPWGADQTWIPTIGVGTPGREVTFDGSGGILFDKCLEDEECFRLYWEALRDITDAVASLDPGQLAGASADLLASWQQEELSNSSREEYTLEDVEDAVDVTRDFIAGRRAEAEAWLEANEPPPGLVVSVPPASQKPAGQAQPSPVQPLHVGRIARKGRAFVTRLWLPGPGLVSQRATVKASKGVRQACSVRAATTGGPQRLRCPLSKWTLASLRSHPLTLRMQTAFSSSADPQSSSLRFARLRVS